MRKLIILLVFLPFLANAQVKISALPEATSIGSSDLFILNQSGTTKKLPYSLLQGTYLTTSRFNDTVTSLKNRTIWGLNANSTGSGLRKVLIGENAGLATTENNIVGLGYNSFYNASSTSLDYSIAIGMNAGYEASGLRSFFGGYMSGRDNSGDYSTFLGAFSGQSNTQDEITSIGYYSGYYNAGVNVSGFGTYSGYRNKGSYNTFIGSYAGYYNSSTGTIANNNTFIGYYATATDSSIVNSTAVGANATVSLDSTVVLGNNADTYVTKDLYLEGNFSSLNDSIYLLSDLSGQDARFDTISADYYTGVVNITGARGEIGFVNTLQNNLDFSPNFLFLDNKLYLNDSSFTTGTGGDTIATKEYVDQIDNYLNIGTPGQIPYTNSTGTDFEYSSNFTWDGNTLALEADSGSNNIFVGNGVGISNTTGSENVFIGYQSGYLNTTGDQSVFIGFEAGKNNTSQFNTFVGYRSGWKNTTGTQNIYYGYESGFENLTGNQNTNIGYRSGYYILGSGNVCLGYNAGQNETGSNKLYIENSSSATPLIYGEFDNDLVKINGYLDADSSVFELQNISAGLIGATDITLANTWQTVKYDTAYSDVTTDSLIFNSDSTGIESRINGYLQFNGHVSLMNQTAGNITATVYLRLLINDVEVSRFNTAKSRTYAAGGSDDLTSHGGIIKVNKGDIIKVQIRSTSTDININSPDGAIFTNVTPFSISLVEKILNK